ncbi:MAG: glycosyltransferase [Armatimonadetes bacterium]|nr:glycosyltransferase [Armatimonadota bacterium]
MKKSPKISIVTPSYNQGGFLEETILSVINQDYPNLEYIIIDGGSTDNSIEIIKKYKEYISYWVSEPDNGQSHAINKGFKKATGDIIAWINSDDIYFNGVFKKVNQVFTQNPDIDVIYSNGVWVDGDGNVIKKRKNTHFHYNTWLYGMADPFQPEVFYHSRVLEKAGYLDESFHMMMDREWWIRMAKKGCKFKYIDDEFAAIRKYSDTKTATLMKVNIEERWKLHDIYWEGFRFQNRVFKYCHWRILNVIYLLRRKILTYLT